MNILLIPHWFPPSNAIGAIRPYEMARYLIDLGHKVHVITSSEKSAKQDLDLELDIEGLSVVNISIPFLLEYMESPKNNVTMKVLRRLFYPDHYIVLRKALYNECRAAFQGSIDLVISSSQPFSTHVLARNISLDLNIPWIADSRDLWADNPYRRSILGSKYLDLYYERRVLSDAQACVVTGSGTKAILHNRLPFQSIKVLRNGADSVGGEFVRADYSDGQISILYTGTLYGGRRDLTPLFEALNGSGLNVAIKFFGSESSYIEQFAKKYSSLLIQDC